MSELPTIPVFDVGGVLMDWSPFHLTDRMGFDRAEAQAVLDEIGFEAWNMALDGGNLWAPSVESLAGAFPQHADFITALDKRWPETVSGLIEGSVSLLEQLLLRDEPVYAITNFSSEKWRLSLDLFPILQRFDGVIVSGDEKLLKPDPAIYWKLIDRYDLQPKSCVFIDDRQDNVDGAKSIGMDAVRFTTPERLRADLKERALLT